MVYALIVEESVGALLMAGFIPGAVSAVIYAAIVILRCKINPQLGRAVTGLTWAERFNSIPGMAPIVAVIAIILGGIYTGWMTPTETGAVGAALIFFMALGRRAIFGEGMTKKDFIDSMMETGKLTVMIFTIIWGVLIYVRFLGFTGLTTAFADWIVHLPVAPIVILLMILGVYINLGMFMEALADNVGRTLNEIYSGAEFTAHAVSPPLAGDGLAALDAAHGMCCRGRTECIGRVVY